MVAWEHVTRGDFEGDKAGAVRVPGKLGFDVREIQRPAK
jgi:hypothetical protein